MSSEPSRKFGRFSLEPKDVGRIETRHRRIATPLPVPESIPILEKILRHEPPSMACQPPILWHRAEGSSVEDRFGNRWIDFSSCVLVANAGHAHPKVAARMRELLDRGHLAAYVFPHEERAALVERLAEIAPPGLGSVFLLTTGSEAVECAIKLTRAWGLRSGRDTIVSFTGGFHGRTMASQLAGGIPALKAWLGGDDPRFVQVPFPDGYLEEDTSFGAFERALAERRIDPSGVAGVLSETYLGIGPDFFPDEYARALRAWCDRHGALLVLDEVQSGFGRTGKLFAFEHHGIVPDLIVCGKGITSSLPLAAVLGRPEVFALHAPGSMTSTHSASPLPVAAALGSLEAIIDDRLVERAAALGPALERGLARIAARWPARVGAVRSRGLVGGVRLVQPGTRIPDPDAAYPVVEAAFRKGLLLFAPVGLGGGCVKIAPPLPIGEEALLEGLAALEESFEEVLG